MTNNPFLKTVFEALEDEINLMDFEKISRMYGTKDLELERIMKTLESLPEIVETKAGSIQVHKLLRELEELRHDLLGISFDIAVKRGFSTAFKLIFHSLTMD